MTMKAHLTVLQNGYETRDEEPTQASRLWNPNRTEFFWNDDFTMFRPVALRWWDDASYVAYQAGDDVSFEEVGEYEDAREGVCETLGMGDCPWWPICQTEPGSEDHIPF